MNLPLPAVLGGLLIGTAAMMMLFLLGRVAGISGIFWAGLVGPERSWRLMFIAGLGLGGLSAYQVLGLPLPTPPQQPLWLAALAGILVGAGTRIGSGCTSGHSVCGIGRRSPRSLAATMVFISAGIATVYLTRHLMG